AVVILGNNGCIAKHGKEVRKSAKFTMYRSMGLVVRVPTIGEAKAIDVTGAGDIFASGFCMKRSLKECCKIGACSGRSVTRSLGGEVTLENRQWLYKQMQIRDLHI
ncbi:hypothetical protein S83_031737, partial [Arachis hypogaea]